MTVSKEFRQALVSLPEKEKDKLLLRLIKKDKVLAARLEFELLGNESAEDLRNALLKRIPETVQSVSSRNYAVGYLTLLMRSLSGEITMHVKVTKDKAGEVVLNIAMLNAVLESNGRKLEASHSVKAARVRTYIIARAFKVLLLIGDLHEDYRSDFNEELGRLGESIASNRLLAKAATANGLDIGWLTSGETPENIREIHTRLRKEGFLK